MITNATRCAIEGGLNPEMAFSMSDSFIRNIEDNMTEPVKIEKATRDAEFEFANAVHDLKGQCVIMYSVISMMRSVSERLLNLSV